MKLAPNMHHIRKHILRELTYTKWARFRDLRPDTVDSNLYSYHLKQLLKEGYVEQDDEKGYRLSPLGLRYVDHVSLETFDQRWQPKILTMVVASNSSGEILMWPKYKQPFIGKWSLPSGKMHYDDASARAAVEREISYLSSAPAKDLEHLGIVAFRTFIKGELVTHTLAHIFRATIADIAITNKQVRWIDPYTLHEVSMSPGTKEIIAAARGAKTFFYESYDIDW